MPGPPNSAHLQGFTVLCVGGLLARVSLPLNLLLSCLAWCRLSPWLVLCSRHACRPLSHLGQMLDCPCFWPACSTSPSGFLFFFYPLCFWRLKSPASPSCVCWLWLVLRDGSWKSVLGQAWMGGSPSVVLLWMRLGVDSLFQQTG